jgi:hypothetical protein
VERMNRVPLLSHLATCHHGEVSFIGSTSTTPCCGFGVAWSW